VYDQVPVGVAHGFAHLPEQDQPLFPSQMVLAAVRQMSEPSTNSITM